MAQATSTGADGLALPPAPASAATARRYVRHALTGHVSNEVIDAAELCASELVSNAVLHAGTPVRLTVMIEPAGVRITVQDASPIAPRHVPHSRTAETGRGLALVSGLSEDCGSAPVAGGGKAVWCLLPLELPATPPEEVYGSWDNELADLLAEEPATPTPPPPPPAVHDTPRQPPGRAEVTEVLLLAYPVRRGMRLREHREAVLRECRLQLLRPELDEHLAARLRRLADQLGARYTADLTDPDRTLVQALLAGQDHVDLRYPVHPGTRTEIDRWRHVIAEADQLSQRGDLMTVTAPPDVTTLATWTVQQFTHQLDGHPPQPWSD